MKESYQDKFIRNYLNALEKNNTSNSKRKTFNVPTQNNFTDLRQQKINETATAWKKTISRDHVTSKKDIESDHQREITIEEHMSNLEKMNSSDDLREKAKHDNENAWRKTVGA